MSEPQPSPKKRMAECAVTALRPLWRLVAYYPLLLLVVVALWAVVSGNVLNDYDAFTQVWHESPLTGVINGMLIAFVLGIVMMAVNLADDKADAHAAKKSCAVPDGAYRLVWVLLLVAFVAPVAWKDRGALGDLAAWQLWLPLGMALMVGGFFLLQVVFKTTNEASKKATEKTPKLTWYLGLGVLVVLGLGYFVMTVAHAVFDQFYFPYLATSVWALLLVAFVTAFLGAVTYLAQQRAAWLYPLLLLFVVLPFLFPQNQIENRLPHMTAAGGGDYYQTPVRLTDVDEVRKTNAGQLNDTAVLETWHKLMCDPVKGYGEAQPVVLVTCSGGASASAIYTADVLFTLEEQCPGFSRRIRLVSGASGGMLGAAYFVTQLRPGGLIHTARQKPEYTAYIDAVNRTIEGKPPLAREAFDTIDAAYRKLMRECRDQFFANLEADFLSPLVQKWIHKDIPLSPFGFLSCVDARFGHTMNDRGAALEQAWSRNLGGALDVPFRALQSEEATGELPSLVFTPMMIEDGRQLIISNLDLDYMTESGRMPDKDEPFNPTKSELLSYTGVEFFKLFPKADQFRLSTAVRMNASFPFFSPSAALPTDPVRHVVDAGYYDNFGMVVATKWLNHEPNRKFLLGKFLADKVTVDKIPQVILLRIKCFGDDQTAKQVPTAGEVRAYAASKGTATVSLTELEPWRERWHGDRAANPIRTEGGLFTVTAPLAGLFSAWRANMVYRSDERLSSAKARLARNDAGATGVVLSDYRILCNVEPSLNWVLTDAMRKAIHADALKYVGNPSMYANFNSNRSSSAEVAVTVNEAPPNAANTLPNVAPPPPVTKTAPKLDGKAVVAKQTKALVEAKKLTPSQLDSAKDKIKLGEFQSNLPLRYAPKK